MRHNDPAAVFFHTSNGRSLNLDNVDEVAWPDFEDAVAIVRFTNRGHTTISYTDALRLAEALEVPCPFVDAMSKPRPTSDPDREPGAPG